METGIYGRVSTEEQAMEGFSIRAQVEKLKQYVSAKSWSIYDVYLDEGISGKNMTARPAINRLIEDIKAGHVKNVLVFKLDRLTRSVADLVYLIELFKTYGCAFNSLCESIDTSTASGRMFVKIIGIFAEFERENIGERVRMGKERKAKEGYTTACRVMSYGYDREFGEKVQRINETEAAIVRRIFEMYVNQNMSLSGITAILNQENIPSKRGNKWNTGVLINLMTNCNYIGNVRYSLENPERYFEAEGRHEAIISEELFQTAQILMEKNRRITPTKKPIEQNYFSGVLYCDTCGRKMASHAHPGKKEDDKPQYSYICYNRISKACAAKMVSTKKVEMAVVEYMAGLMTAALETDRREKAAAAKKAAAERVEALKNRLTVLDAKEKEILDSYIEDKTSLVEYRGVKKQFDSERERVIVEIENLTPDETEHSHAESMTQEEIIAAFNTDWHKLSDLQKRQFLLKYIRKINIVNHKIKGHNEGKTEITGIEFNSSN